jgi:hypothetical protein
VVFYSKRLAREIHSRITQGVPGERFTPGEFRRKQEHIGYPDNTLANAQYVLLPTGELMVAWEKGIGFMDYREFTDLWLEALRQAHFPSLHFLRPVETVDIRSMDRTYRAYLWWPGTPETKLFSVIAEISWEWDALLSGRFATTEEDMLMQIYGDFGIHEDTELPWLRIDVTLHASISLDTHFPLPLLANWQRWVEEVELELEPILPGGSEGEDEDQDSLAWHGTPEAVIIFDSEGHTFLQRVSLKAWQGITLPRQWDDPEKTDPDPYKQLYEFATRIRQALEIWQGSLVYLVEA